MNEEKSIIEYLFSNDTGDAHANVWYTSTGGVKALDTMLSDLEGALLN